MAENKENHNGIVYSTKHGIMCPKCTKSIAKCVCNHKKSLYHGDGIVRIGMEIKGRNGKGMTVITGVPLNRGELTKLGKQFKKKCGTGGTVKDGIIEIQGDHRDALEEELKKQGWVVRRCGG